MNWNTVPKRYQNAKLKAKTDDQKKLIKALAKSDNDLIVIGNIGTGKTQIVTAYVNELTRLGVTAKYITEYDYAGICAEQHSSANDVALHAKREIMHAKTYNTLVIDEVGKRVLTDKQNIEIDELISSRYNNLTRTIIVSNLSAAEVKDRIKDRAYDRLKDNDAKLIVLSGESLRGEK